MTKLLGEAIAKVRELPAQDQDAFAAAILSMPDEETPVGQLDEETRAAIGKGLAQTQRGEFASDQEMEALWKRHSV
jgi:hypothetical protein